MVSAGDSRVLIVEDDEDVREMLKEILEAQGYRVHTAVNGREALTLLDGGLEPRVVLLDLFMPVVDGWEVYETLRRDGRLETMTVIITTSATHRIPAGASVLEKPLDFEQVIRAVAAVC
jgi:CheY-like chemotaxis protein